MYVFEDLMKVLKDSNRPYDFDKITEAYRYAEKAHDGQMRQSGEPYITHPIAVAQILVELGMDTETICAGLLHDVVEDTSSTIEEIKKIFGADVALMVDGVTKLTKLSYSSKEQRQAENVRKMLLAMAKDVRVIIVKLSDRLHNMRTGEYWKEYKRREKALETMEVYAPLADRLGIRPIKEELEDISLRFLDPIAYEEIERLLKLKKDEREKFLETIQQKIKERLDKEHMKFFLQSRVKSIYGIYRKVYMQGRNFDEIYDVYAVRVIVDTSIECYSVLGIMHDEFTPIPKRFKDYISTPKANMYQSLHTTVLDKEGGIPFEIQIRTWDMHYTAEYGIAAHWKYKAGIEKKDKLEERLAWVRQLLEVQQDSGDAQDIVRSIKSDIAPEECFVFTPKGDVINLPTGSTVIDFAYAIHSEVGNRMTGAKVDGRIVSLDFKLETGMIVEIITSKGPGVFLVLKPQSIGLLLSIIIGYQQGIGITHNHTLVRYIQPLLFTESKALLSEVDPLSAFFLQISFHGVKIFLLQPGKYIDSCRSQPVIYINIRFVRVLHRNSCLYLQTFTLIKSILRRKLQYTFHCVNACQFHIYRRNIPEHRNMQCICVCINCIETPRQFLSNQFATFIYFYSYCRNIMRYDHIIYPDHRAPYCGIFFHSPYASQAQSYH